ncbi:23S rRNA (adenine(1618)-N(6))-methyltransferase RlmF [Chitinimonas sp. BJB300]|uniref:23S rRNA (adenine(1618)-N(6))-methyltransferase RlmF n=1 Tax=Chitinimonas sp. BJB300 TaxID=1559339 RepID=UPI000C0D0937|nr:23S rRNA (adenine(1618)-N(6))-methyltransferase RlmF [Chitinimonas sp. BJB300]PHV10739.1 23S rRNA (adenine(1618)-N(6))-methyltransferase RlmF [Chitinimonas sp. BJB300]TSJ91240.1 23S rRNA (adenine(1618)-N(6))-methyltransferase RlmF [Chitinimonas sp. BJB300]
MHKKSSTPRQPATEKTSLHPRNAHRSRYDFTALIATSPELASFVAKNAYGDESIDFAAPAAVKALNRALLQQFYGVQEWDIPPDYLCPPIPGRADYLHYLADLLADSAGGSIQRGAEIRVLDIGVGANAIYPLIGHAAYGWQFVGTEIDPIALTNAARILAANPAFEQAIELRQQHQSQRFFEGIIQAGEWFDLCLCNPPFHASLAEATVGSKRKWQNLGKANAGSKQQPVLNFGGHGGELWCDGGEEAFIGRMIEESAAFPTACFWFTSLVSKATSLPGIYRALETVGVQASHTIEMAQGQKQSRIVAWTFYDGRQQNAWRKMRLGK